MAEVTTLQALKGNDASAGGSRWQLPPARLGLK